MKTQDIYTQIYSLLDKNESSDYLAAVDDCLQILRNHGFDEPKFAHLWSHDDIQVCLDERGYKPLSPKQLGKVADLILEGHDYEDGITQEVIMSTCFTLKVLVDNDE